MRNTVKREVGNVKHEGMDDMESVGRSVVGGMILLSAMRYALCDNKP